MIAQILRGIFMNYYNNLYKICQEKGTTPTGLLNKMNISNSKATAWKNGSTPKLELAVRIAEELNEPIERFIDDDWKPEEKNPQHEELIACFDSLDRSGQAQLLGKAYELKEANTKKDKNNSNNSNVVAPISAISVTE